MSCTAELSCKVTCCSPRGYRKCVRTLPHRPLLPASSTCLQTVARSVACFGSLFSIPGSWFPSLALARRPIISAMVPGDHTRRARSNVGQGDSSNKDNVSPHDHMYSSPYVDQDHHVINYLRNRYGDEMVNKMDLTPFTGCYVHSLLSSLYPPHLNEPTQIRQNHGS